MPAAYHPDFGQVVNYSFEAVPDDPDAQVEIAVERVIGYALADSSDPLIQEQAQKCLELGGGDPIAGVWAHVKPHIRFKEDIDIAEALNVTDARKSGAVEVFIRPVDQARLIQERGQGVEDCDGFTGYGLCLLTALGVPCTLATVAADARDPSRYSHIYIVAYPGAGRRVAVDLSHGKFPGWECPNLGRAKEWPVDDDLNIRRLWPLMIIAALAWFASRLIHT